MNFVTEKKIIKKNDLKSSCDDMSITHKACVKEDEYKCSKDPAYPKIDDREESDQRKELEETSKLNHCSNCSNESHLKHASKLIQAEDGVEEILYSSDENSEEENEDTCEVDTELLKKMAKAEMFSRLFHLNSRRVFSETLDVVKELDEKQLKIEK